MRSEAEADCLRDQTVQLEDGVPIGRFGAATTGRARFGAREQIAAERNQAGGWNEVSHMCYLGADFSTVAKNYQTVQIVVLAYRQSRDGKQQARARGEIYAYRGNGLCNSAEANSPPRRPRP